MDKKSLKVHIIGALFCLVMGICCLFIPDILSSMLGMYTLRDDLTLRIIGFVVAVVFWGIGIIPVHKCWKDIRDMIKNGGLKNPKAYSFLAKALIACAVIICVFLE